MKKTDHPIVVEEIYEVSVKELWQAITEPQQMRQWFFENIENFEAVVGFETSFIISNEGRVFPHLWKITEVVPQKKLAINWKYKNYSGDSVVTFELFELKQGVKLNLSHDILESFPEHIPEFSRTNCKAGWEYFIQNSLKNYLKKI
ncbi:MAG: SRPBCC domain-containing protein [Psychroflexus sp.]